MADKELTKFLAGVVGVVEANSFEQMKLWKETTERGLTWKQGGGGPLETIGHVGKRPICLALSVETVDGHRLLFMDATSQVVDHALIEQWLEKTMPVTAFEGNDPRKRLNHVDAMNFSNVLPRAPAAPTQSARVTIDLAVLDRIIATVERRAQGLYWDMAQSEAWAGIMGDLDALKATRAKLAQAHGEG